MHFLRTRTVLAALFISVSLARSASAQTPLSSAPVETIDKVVVAADRYKPMGAPGPMFGRFMLSPQPPPEFPFGEREGFSTAAQIGEGLPLVTSDATLLPSDEIRTRSGVLSDWVMRDVPEFAAQRRSALIGQRQFSLPGWRGVASPNSAGAAVLLDGFTITNPMDGTFSWGAVPSETLGRLEFAAGAGAPAWGTGTQAGALQFFLPPMRTELFIIDHPPESISLNWKGVVRLSAALGDFGTRSLEFAATLPKQQDVVQITARSFATAGFPLLDAAERGRVDTAADSRHQWVNVRWLHPFGQDLGLLTTLRGFSESRGLGTNYSRQTEREMFVGVGLVARTNRRFAWKGQVYVQTNAGSEQASYVNLDRSNEVPVVDLFDMPSTTAGASATMRYASGIGTFAAGIDGRSTHGEFRLHARYVDGQFNETWLTGGESNGVGVFAFHDRGWGPNLQSTLGVRLDYWTLQQGHLDLRDGSSDAVRSARQFPAKREANPSVSAGTAWLAPSGIWRIRANAQRSFRTPTLAESFRPDFTNNTLNLPNPGLASEFGTTGEVAVEWRLYDRIAPRPANFPRNMIYRPSPPRRLLTLSATSFLGRIDDSIQSPDSALQSPLAPAGAEVRERVNARYADSQGIEVGFRWVPMASLTLEGSFVRQETAVRSTLSTKSDLPFVPRRVGLVTASWTAGKSTVRSRIRWIGREFTDVENDLSIHDVVIGEFGVSRTVGADQEVFLNVENVGNARIVANRTAGGLTVLGPPRWVLFGFRGKW